MPDKLKVVLVDDDPGRTAILEQALGDAGYRVIARLPSCDQLNAEIARLQPDVIIIDMESPGRDILEHMQSITNERPKPIVMFANQSDSGTIEKAIKAGVSAYIVDGLNAARVKPIIEVAIARFREYHALRQELQDTKAKLSERKLIERAKGILMEKRNMGEDEAYKALRKMAMDRNIRLVQAAENVIAVADLLG
jgi:response regulator NasT